MVLGHTSPDYGLSILLQIFRKQPFHIVFSPYQLNTTIVFKNFEILSNIIFVVSGNVESL